MSEASPPAACPDHRALPGPSGRCFYYLRPRPGMPPPLEPFCGHTARPETDCPTDGYLYPQFFPVRAAGRKFKRKKRKRKG